MSIEVILEGKLEKEKDKEVFSAYLKDVCDELHIKMEDYDTLVQIDVCPEGSIECSYEGLFVSVVAQTNVAGPGFHAFVCTLFDEILENSGITWEPSDPTGYFEKRDFEDLKYTYFYRWLRDIATYVCVHHEEQNELCISWPLQYYQPVPKKGMVVTPMGYIAVDDFRTKDIEELADMFFIWNEQEFSARYYRNCALNLLWKECFFTFSAMNDISDKSANSIIDYIEAAYDKDDTLALPLDSYDTLCTSIERIPLIQEGKGNRMKETAIGYRKDIVFYPFGNWQIPVDGCSERSFDTSRKTMHFMAPYKQADTPWSWLINVSGYTFEKEQTTYAEMFEHPTQTVIESFDLNLQNCVGKAIIQRNEEYSVMSIQVNAHKETLFVEYLVNKEEDLVKMKEWCHKIKYQVINESEEIKN